MKKKIISENDFVHIEFVPHDRDRIFHITPRSEWLTSNQEYGNTAEIIRHLVVELFFSPRRGFNQIIFNCENIQTIDYPGLTLLWELNRSVHLDFGNRLALYRLNAKVKELIKSISLDATFSIFDSFEEYLNSLSKN